MTTVLIIVILFVLLIASVVVFKLLLSCRGKTGGGFSSMIIGTPEERKAKHRAELMGRRRPRLRKIIKPFYKVAKASCELDPECELPKKEALWKSALKSAATPQLTTHGNVFMPRQKSRSEKLGTMLVARSRMDIPAYDAIINNLDLFNDKYYKSATKRNPIKVEVKAVLGKVGPRELIEIVKSELGDKTLKTTTKVFSRNAFS